MARTAGAMSADIESDPLQPPSIVKHRPTKSGSTCRKACFAMRQARPLVRTGEYRLHRQGLLDYPETGLQFGTYPEPKAALYA